MLFLVVLAYPRRSAMNIYLRISVCLLAIGLVDCNKKVTTSSTQVPTPAWPGQTQTALEAWEVVGSPLPTLGIRSSSPFFGFSVTESGFILFICQRAQAGQEKSGTGLCLIDPRPALKKAAIYEHVLVEPDAENGNVITAIGAGRWIAYATEAKQQRLWMLNIDTGKRWQIGTISNGQVANQNGPSYVVDDLGRLAWVDEYRIKDSMQNVIHFSKATYNSDQVLVKLPPSIMVESLTLSQDKLVYNTAEPIGSAERQNKLYEYSLSKGSTQLLSNEKNASQPMIAGDLLVYKTGATFSSGGISLLNLLNNNLKELMPMDEGIAKGCDAPSIGAIGITGWCTANSSVFLWLFSGASPILLDSRGARPYTSGRYVIWASDSLSSAKKSILAWSDLSSLR